jgi:hypothetical protein
MLLLHWNRVEGTSLKAKSSASPRLRVNKETRRPRAHRLQGAKSGETPTLPWNDGAVSSSPRANACFRASRDAAAWHSLLPWQFTIRPLSRRMTFGMV